MDLNKQEKLKSLMSEYFGSEGLLILLSAVKKLGFPNLVGLSADQKEELTNYLLDKVFSKVVSTNRIPFLESELRSIFAINLDSV